jgi:redox-sensitive bicupin YhaK (pirin superfamily)
METSAMSKRSEPVSAESCEALGAGERRLESYPSRELALGSMPITRILPVRDRRLVGPWCFLDRFGPLSFTNEKPMDVAPHPHIGLQTVTWLLAGEVVHDDSLGSQAVLRPNGVNVMTSGAGIAHAEQTPRDHTGRLNGVQLWTALPGEARHVGAAFAHVPEVPAVESAAGIARVFAGTLLGAASPAPYYSALVGADLQVHGGSGLDVPLDPSFEHAVVTLEGDACVEGEPLQDRTLYYLGTRRTVMNVSSRRGGRLLLVGGPPFPETILMWWNFVARSREEIAEARADWEAHRRFGDVPAYRGPRLAAPELIRLARPEPVS